MDVRDHPPRYRRWYRLDHNLRDHPPAIAGGTDSPSCSARDHPPATAGGTEIRLDPSPAGSDPSLHSHDSSPDQTGLNPDRSDPSLHGHDPSPDRSDPSVHSHHPSPDRADPSAPWP